MKVTLEWLKKHLTRDLEITEILTAFNSLSIEVDEVNKLGGIGYYVAEIIHIEAHPNSEKLHLCTVKFMRNNQEDTKIVVCGASNVRIGLITLLAEIGTTLPNGVTLTARKIRGVVSEGMLLSYEEFGLKHVKKDGIIDESIDLLNQWVKEDYVITIGLPANRIDLSSVRGLAEELAGYFHCLLHNLYTSQDIHKRSKIHLPVEIESPDLCSLFSTIEIDNIKIKENYNSLLALLFKVQHPTSIAIVNVANFITLDMGVPLHIYDKDKISGLKVSLMDVRTDFIPLNGNNIALEPGYLVIKDIKTNEALVLAGIIGGKNFACTADTKNILIEAAIFNKEYFIAGYRGTNIQNTSTYYFNRGINVTHYLLALEYFREFVHGDFNYAQLQTFTNKLSMEPKEIFLSYKEFYQLTGVAISLDKIIHLLDGYGYKCSIVNPDTEGLNQEMGLSIIVPVSKSHIKTSRDLIEEIFRVGSAIGVIKPSHQDIKLQVNVVSSPLQQLFAIQDLLVANGYKEVISYSFTDEENSNNIYISNAIGINKYLRSNIRGSLQEYINNIIAHKLNMEYSGNLFEISKVFYQTEGVIKEHYNLAIAMISNPHHYRSVNIEQQAVNILSKLGDLQIMGDKILQGNKVIGNIFYNKNSEYLIMEIINVKQLYTTTTNEHKPYMGVSHCRDYSCLMSEEQFTNIYYKELKKYKDISYSLFDQYKTSYGLRVKYLMEDITNREKDILSIFGKYQVTLR